VRDTIKPKEGLFVHLGTLETGGLSEGDAVELEVDHDARAATRRNHSATHLLHLALRAVVGPHAMQKGSLVGPDRLRFDYSGAHPLTPDQIAQIEDMVTERVLQNAEVVTDVLPMDEAKERGAIGIFEEKYGDVVRMLTIADSKELCGGTHVQRTGDIGGFKILSEGGIAAGVRRIEAATGENALRYARGLERELSETAALVKGSPAEVVDKVRRLLERQKEQAREIEQLKRKLVSGGSGDLSADAREFDGGKVLGAQVDLGDAKALRELADQLRDRLAPAVVALGSPTADGKVLLVCTVSRDLTKRFRAGDLVKEMASIVGGGGGGRPDFAQAGGSDPSKLDRAVARVYELVAG
jgi:alanyl-tRNA synthetase